MTGREDYTLRAVANEFNAILDRDGILDPEQMHDEFAAKTHPLHARYEWNDKIAGRAYRINQIRQDIRLVRVQFVSEETGEVESVRAYSSLKYSTRPDAKGYVETANLVVEDPVAAKLLQRRLIRQIANLRQQYGHLNDFLQIVSRELGLGEEAS